MVLDRVREDHDKAKLIFDELKAKVGEAEAEREEEEDMLEGGGEGRGTLLKRHEELQKEVLGLRKELASHRENDPMEVEKKRTETAGLKAEVEKWTDKILTMEGWLKKRMGADKEQWLSHKTAWYGAEFDAEEEGLREIV